MSLYMAELLNKKKKSTLTFYSCLIKYNYFLGGLQRVSDWINTLIQLETHDIAVQQRHLGRPCKQWTARL